MRVSGWGIGLLLLSLICTGVSQTTGDNRGGTQDYALPFGPNPYLPSQAQSSFQVFLAPKDFPPASYCGKCHEGVHAQWRQSAHANSFRAPFYLKNVEMLIAAKGIEYSRHCEGCHNPVALFTGALTRGSKVDRSFDEDGITCSVCHSIERIQNTSGTGSYVMGRPAVMVDAAGRPMAGLPTYDEILANPGRHKQAVMKPLYRSAEFCSVCHKAAVPKDLGGYRWLRMFAVYDEWQNSSWAKESPLPFYKKEAVSTCQKCHMPLDDVQHDYTQVPGKAASHRWLGANTAIPAVYAYGEQLAKTTQYLQTALKMDLFAVEKEQPARQLIAPLGVEPADLRPGETIVVDLLVQNTGTGHNLVPEQRDFYECWVEFDAADALGKSFFHSGGLDKQGMLDAKAHSYTNRLLSADGKLLDRHQVWETRLRSYDNTIPSGRTDLIRFRFRIPANVQGAVVLTARVNYRRFRRDYTNFIYPDQRTFPVVTMAATSTSLRMGENGPVLAPDPKSVILRWNNYGIALLGEQQYEAAERAFRKVIALDAAYVDGYINQALAIVANLVENKKELPDGTGNMSLGNRSRGQFDPALKLLQEALRRRPGDARALYYTALVLRYQGKLKEAVALQQQVLALFPRSRHAQQELGYSHYLLGDFKSAAAAFEALQSINPDDLTAHYYLSIIYGKQDRKEEAAREASAYAEHREDITTGSIAQAYWRASPFLVNELAPYHVHENTVRPPKSLTVGGYLP